MRRALGDGFTLVELMIVIGIVGLLFAVLVPALLLPRAMAYGIADRANLQQQAQWLAAHEQKLDRLPLGGGHRFVLALWTSGVAAPTLENFDRFWTPGPARSSDPRYHELRLLVARGGDPWPDLAATTSLDTHYAGRAREHLATARVGYEQALMGNDNELGWSLPDGTVNVLFNSGVVRSYSYEALREIYGLPAFDPAVPLATAGPASPIEHCRRLAH